MHGSRTGRITMVAALFAAIAACSDDTTDPASINDFYAIVNGASERPDPVSTNASGTATFTSTGTSITFSITYSGLSGPPTASHIHQGGPTGSGGVRLNLCSAGNAPNCPTGTSGTISGTADATYLATGATMAEVLDRMRGFGAYVNIHTTANPGGEIRGNIVGVQ